MKAWEALEILESLPADTEVTLTIGRKNVPSLNSLPKWAQMPQPIWINKQTPRFGETMCKQVFH